MPEASRIGYAQARVQARFAARPREALWRELEAGREYAHLLEILRAGVPAALSASLAATVDGHALESQLRVHWARACAEVAGWYPPAWRAAMEWLGWLPWLPLLGWLAARADPQAWMRNDPRLGELAAAETGDRAGLVSSGALAPLAEAWRGAGDLAEAWHSHWRESWPAVDGQAFRGLARLDATLARLWPGAAEELPCDTLIEAGEADVTRVFRRCAGTAVAGLAYLVLLALDHLRLRAALAAARSFGQARGS